VRLCLDAISSIGTVPVDLRGIYLASCASGKGLRSYPGLALVYYQHEVAPAPDALPRYLDLGHYAAEQGIPFSFSSNLLHALHAAVHGVDWERRFAEVEAMAALLRRKLCGLGVKLIGNGQTSPAVFTLELPPEIDSAEFGVRLQEDGFLLSCNSDYLRRRNWIQICLMGECTREQIVALTHALRRWVPGEGWSTGPRLL
jgi:aspartate aminotransferase-like enzyme